MRLPVRSRLSNFEMMSSKVALLLNSTYVSFAVGETEKIILHTDKVNMLKEDTF